MLKKRINLSFSKKYPNGDIVSFQVGTELDTECLSESDLFDKVYQSTIADLKKLKETDQLVADVLKQIGVDVFNSKKVGDTLWDGYTK
jgi:hypothetical protein